MQEFSYAKISKTPSDAVSEILNAHEALVCGGVYLMLGLADRRVAGGRWVKEIVLVDSNGKVVTLPYDQKSFDLSGDFL